MMPALSQSAAGEGRGMYHMQMAPPENRRHTGGVLENSEWLAEACGWQQYVASDAAAAGVDAVHYLYW